MNKNAMLKKLSSILEVLNKFEKTTTDNFEIFSNIYDELELSKLKEKFENYKYKLENNIMEIAFVGSESAGKSTFINAFIEKEILPTADKRTTYTTTQVKYADEDKVEISFYTKEEFLNIFRNLLKDIDYPNYEKHNLNTVDIEELRNLIRKTFSKEIHQFLEDLIDILEGKQIIEKYLGKGIHTFSVEDVETYKKFITSKYESRAVKEVKIFSSKLESIKNVVIYDLPGFTSPNFKHSEFTIEKIKIADAVVFLKEADKPSFIDKEVTIILSTKEEDGLPLKEKIFFFNTKTDKLDSKEQLEENKEEFISNLIKYELTVPEDRVIYGSSKARLEILNNSEKKPACEKLKELGIEDGIEKLKKELIKYNESERLKHLERRINKLIEDFKENYIKKSEMIISKQIEEKSSSETTLIFNAIDEFYSAIENNHIEDFVISYKDEIRNKNPITEELLKIIENLDLIPDDKEKERIIKYLKAKNVNAVNLPGEYSEKLREKFSEKLEKKLYNIVSDILLKYGTDFEKKCAEKIAEIMKVPDSEKETFIKKLREFFNENISNIKEESLGIKMLFIKLTRPLVEILSRPLNSEDRKKLFEVHKNDIYSLAAYDENFSPEYPLKFTPLVSLLLKQIKPNLIYNIFKELNLYTDKLIKLTLPIPKDYIGFLLRNFISENLDIILKFENPVEFVKEFLEEFFEERISEKEENKIDYKKEIENHFSYLQKNKNVKKQSNKEDNYEDYKKIDKEVEKDSEILKHILKNNVLNSISPEQALLSMITFFYNNLQNLANKKINNKIREFIKQNITLIKKEEYENSIRNETLKIKLQELEKYIKELKKELEVI